MTIDDLVTKLIQFPNAAQVHAQVIAEDGTAWNMNLTVSEVSGSKPLAAVVTMRHPELKTLPTEEDQNTNQTT